jgi:hypothetical protein
MAECIPLSGDGDMATAAELRKIVGTIERYIRTYVPQWDRGAQRSFSECKRCGISTTRTSERQEKERL